MLRLASGDWPDMRGRPVQLKAGDGLTSRSGHRPVLGPGRCCGNMRLMGLASCAGTRCAVKLITARHARPGR